MDWQGIIPEILTFIAGGGIVGLFTIPAKKKKANVEVKVDEIAALHDIIEKVYEPTIKFQKERISELENQVKSLQEQLSKERADRQREMELMNKRILAITSALGLKAETQIRDGRRRSAKAPEDEA